MNEPAFLVDADPYISRIDSIFEHGAEDPSLTPEAVTRAVSNPVGAKCKFELRDGAFYVVLDSLSDRPDGTKPAIPFETVLTLIARHQYDQIMQSPNAAADTGRTVKAFIPQIVAFADKQAVPDRQKLEPLIDLALLWRYLSDKEIRPGEKDETARLIAESYHPEKIMSLSELKDTLHVTEADLEQVLKFEPGEIPDIVIKKEELPDVVVSRDEV